MLLTTQIKTNISAGFIIHERTTTISIYSQSSINTSNTTPFYNLFLLFKLNLRLLFKLNLRLLLNLNLKLLFKLNLRLLFKWITSECFLLKKETGNFWWSLSRRTSFCLINSKTIIERGEIVPNSNGFRLISQFLLSNIFFC
jgi:hypothetical protein